MPVIVYCHFYGGTGHPDEAQELRDALLVESERAEVEDRRLDKLHEEPNLGAEFLARDTEEARSLVARAVEGTDLWPLYFRVMDEWSSDLLSRYWESLDEEPTA